MEQKHLTSPSPQIKYRTFELSPIDLIDFSYSKKHECSSPFIEAQQEKPFKQILQNQHEESSQSSADIDQQNSYMPISDIFGNFIPSPSSRFEELRHDDQSIDRIAQFDDDKENCNKMATPLKLNKFINTLNRSPLQDITYTLKKKQGSKKKSVSEVKNFLLTMTPKTMAESRISIGSNKRLQMSRM